ncbi:hypothetical protein EDC04DRAFT_2914984 [Pisolithus marmoratus]|nr:hypothetical protein EDC04DRAFT_2914984 [Pisolithus marmoratus]
MSSLAPEDVLLQSFSVLLMVYSKIKKTSTKGKTVSKEEKSTKMKELLFSLSNSNYVNFLQAILHKHGLIEYEVTEKKHFPLKYIPLKARGRQWVSDAIDVNNLADYREMVKKISEYEGELSVEKLPQASKSNGSGSSKDGDSEPISDSPKVYKNENDEGLTYIGPHGPIPLTPAMVHDWCLVLEDGQATIATPLNIESFNPANKAPILHPVCKAALQPATPAMMDLNSLTLAILLWTLTQLDSGLIHSLASPTPAPTLPTPQTPIQHQVHSMLLLPIPSPRQVVCYLQYAETNLGVHHALLYKSAFELHGIGPDILPNIDNKFLAGLGLSAGDVIHLKRGSIAWWNSPNAKQKQSDASASNLPSKRSHPLDS